jgi:DNA mismatch endonuclease, patch repair protein
MENQGRRDTAPELSLRQELFRRGLRYRVDYRAIPAIRGRADVAFTRAKVAVFVDGCFWHSCPLHTSVPKNNREWWLAKLAGNVARDRATDEALQVAGWAVIRVWEHEDAVAAADDIEELVRRRVSQ